MKTIFLAFLTTVLAVPTFAQYNIFWADKSAQTITNHNEENKQTEVFTSQTEDVTRVKIDAVNQRIFWVDKTMGTFYQSNINSNNQSVAFKAKTKVSVFAIDQANQLIYYAEDKNHRIMRANMDGTDAEVFATEVGMVKGIAFDNNSQNVFYTDLIKGTINKKPMNGEASVAIYTNEDQILFDLCTDQINEQLYFTDRANNTISRISFTGENLSEVIELNNLAGTIAIDAEFSKIFYKEGDQLNMANLDGTDITMLAEGIKQLSGLDIVNESATLSMARKK